MSRFFEHRIAKIFVASLLVWLFLMVSMLVSDYRGHDFWGFFGKHIFKTALWSLGLAAMQSAIFAASFFAFRSVERRWLRWSAMVVFWMIAFLIVRQVVFF